MTTAKALICSIIGPSGKSGDILAEAVDRVKGVLSLEGDLPSGFQWERDIFYEMGKKYGEKPRSAQKAAARKAHEVFDALRKNGEKMAEVIGMEINERPDPSITMLYLAYYTRFEQPYFALMRRWSQKK